VNNIIQFIIKNLLLKNEVEPTRSFLNHGDGLKWFLICSLDPIGDSQSVKSSLGRLKPQVEGVVLNCSRVHKGADSRKHGISSL